MAEPEGIRVSASCTASASLMSEEGEDSSATQQSESLNSTKDSCGSKDTTSDRENPGSVTLDSPYDMDRRDASSSTSEESDSPFDDDCNSASSFVSSDTSVELDSSSLEANTGNCLNEGEVEAIPEGDSTPQQEITTADVDLDPPGVHPQEPDANDLSDSSGFSEIDTEPSLMDENAKTERNSEAPLLDCENQESDDKTTSIVDAQADKQEPPEVDEALSKDNKEVQTAPKESLDKDLTETLSTVQGTEENPSPSESKSNISAEAPSELEGLEGLPENKSCHAMECSSTARSIEFDEDISTPDVKETDATEGISTPDDEETDTTEAVSKPDVKEGYSIKPESAEMCESARIIKVGDPQSGDFVSMNEETVNKHVDSNFDKGNRGMMPLLEANSSSCSLTSVVCLSSETATPPTNENTSELINSRTVCTSQGTAAQRLDTENLTCNDIVPSTDIEEKLELPESGSQSRGLDDDKALETANDLFCMRYEDLSVSDSSERSRIILTESADMIQQPHLEDAASSVHLTFPTGLDPHGGENDGDYDSQSKPQPTPSCVTSLSEGGTSEADEQECPVDTGASGCPRCLDVKVHQTMEQLEKKDDTDTQAITPLAIAVTQRSMSADPSTDLKQFYDEASPEKDHDCNPETQESDDDIEDALMRGEGAVTLPDEHELNTNAIALISFISAEPSWNGTELVYDNVLRHVESETSAESSNDVSLSKVGPPLSKGDPLLVRLLLNETRSMASSEVIQNTINLCNQDRRDTEDPIASQEMNLEQKSKDNRAREDPEGTSVKESHDSSLLSGGKKASKTELTSTPQPKHRVSFATMHTGPNYDIRGQYATPLSLYGQPPPSTGNDQRRADFAAYLRKRMMHNGNGSSIEESDNIADKFIEGRPSQRSQDGIPEVLDPVICNSVESSFTTFVSKSDIVKDEHAEVDTIFSALEKFSRMGGGSKSKHEEESESGDSGCSGSEYSSDDETKSVMSMNFLSSWFTQVDSTRDNLTSDTEPTACEQWALPSVTKLENLLQVVTDFGLIDTDMKRIKHRDQNSEQDDLSDFVDELESGERFEDDREPQSGKQKSAVTLKECPYDMDINTTVSREQQDCGILTFEDIHELAIMAANIIEASTRELKAKEEPLTLEDRHYGLDVEIAAWENVEHTVDDLESVTGQTLDSAKKKTNGRIAAKLEHIKKTQPQIYKVFLAKIAAAEKSGRTAVCQVETTAEDLNADGGHHSYNSSASKEKISPNDISSGVAKQVPKAQDKPRVLEERKSFDNQVPVHSFDWEIFSDSPFKEPSYESFLGEGISVDDDDASIFDDFKWLSSATDSLKDSFASTMESFLGTQKGRPLKDRLVQYGKTHPSFYRILVAKFAERNETSEQCLSSSESATHFVAVDRNAPSRPDEDTWKEDATPMAPVDTKNGHVASSKIKQDFQGVRLTNKVDAVEDDDQLQSSTRTPSPQSPPQKIQEQILTSGGAVRPEEDQSKIKPLKGILRRAVTDSSLINRASQNVLYSGSNHLPSRIKANNARPNKAGANVEKKEIDSKNMFAKKLEFFAKKRKLSKLKRGATKTTVVSTSTNEADAEMVKRVTVKELKQRKASLKPLRAPRHVSLSSTSNDKATEAELRHKFEPMVGQGKEDYNSATRSKTPLFSNRSADERSRQVTNQKKVSKVDRLAPPLCSNGSARSRIGRHRVASKVSATRLSESKSAPTSAQTTESYEPFSSSFSENARNEKPSSSSFMSSANNWEAFDGSRFKHFVRQSFADPDKAKRAKESKSKALDYFLPWTSRNESEKLSPQIDLGETSFLDSLLPSPPSFSGKSHFQEEQHDQFSFSGAAGAQWEHFSPLSFDTKATNWGPKTRKAKAAAAGHPGKSGVRSDLNMVSPSSIAEF